MSAIKFKVGEPQAVTLAFDQPKTGTNVTFNSGTGLLTATGFSGNLTGTLQIVSHS